MGDGARRSFLYTPSDSMEIMEKAVESEADAVIFDLEDAISTAAVPDGRDNITDLLATRDPTGPELCSRINGMETDHWLRDLQTVVTAGVDIVLVPKVETATQVRTVSKVLSQSRESIPDVSLTIESPKGLANLEAIVEEASRHIEMTGLSFGLADFTLSLGGTGTPELLRDKLLIDTAVGAALGNLAPYLTVHQDHTDIEGLRSVAERARSVGYEGQRAIHPDQIPVINDVFTPSDEAIEQARRMVEAFDDSSKDSIVVDGTFLDTAIVDQYRRLLARAEDVRE